VVCGRWWSCRRCSLAFCGRSAPLVGGPAAVDGGTAPVTVAALRIGGARVGACEGGRCRPRHTSCRGNVCTCVADARGQPDRFTTREVFLHGGRCRLRPGYTVFAVGGSGCPVLLVAFLLCGVGIGFAETAGSTVIAKGLPDRLRANGVRGVHGLMRAFGDLGPTLIARLPWSGAADGRVLLCRGVDGRFGAGLGSARTETDPTAIRADPGGTPIRMRCAFPTRRTAPAWHLTGTTAGRRAHHPVRVESP
jgi:hypothetical protein